MAPQLNKKTIENLIKLSRIDCTEAEQDTLLEDLKQILGYIEQLESLDTTGVPACNHVLAEIFNVMRDDDVCETMPRELFLSNAPSHIGGLIRVPPVLKQE